MLRSLAAAGFLSLAVLSSASAQVAGTATLGVNVTETRAVAEGWSAKRQLIGQTVVNEQGDKIGEIEDLIIAPDGKVSLAILSVGGFIGIGERRVAVPISSLNEGDKKAIFAGATKDALKQLPEFKYVR
jgi:hypothetical protein